MAGAGSEKAFQPQGDHGHNAAGEDREGMRNLVESCVVWPCLWYSKIMRTKSLKQAKPMRIKEFGPGKGWWENREENEHAWKVEIEQLKASGHNLDIKNPHVGELESHDPRRAAGDRPLMAEVSGTGEALKKEIMGCLGRNK